MSRPYMVPEKIPEIHFVDHDDTVDVETQGEQRSLLYSPNRGEIKHRHAVPHRKLIVVIVALLLKSVVATIGALKMRCGGEHAGDDVRHVDHIPSVFKRIAVPPGWESKSNDLTEVETTTKRIAVPSGWYEKSDDLKEVETTADVTKRMAVPAGSKETTDEGNLFERDFTFKRPGSLLSSTRTTVPEVVIQSQLPKKLKSFANAEVFGYVHQSYGKRPVAEAQADLLAYAAWKAPKIGISLDGIFFDESLDTAANTPYVATANTFAKAQGLSTTIQNAKTVPSREYFASTQNTDITVVLEDSFDDYNTIAAKYDGLAAKYGVSKSAFSFII
ncbi:uncharacterized protein DFL_004363 [Arthrobotrys flagrans]|uniref:Uncharacterized protein n=1 Tax=Arthrobotrys flagrans TaxID=97331 RepID=A0A437A4N4_ARTFL|nr:hypothetical protein DFL_004363 [Arthrobotrys flagrans]